MPEVTRDIWIDRPVDEVFDRLNDASFAPEWSTTVDEAEADGEPEVGQTFRVKGSFLGKTVEMNCEVTEHDPPTRYAYHADEPLKMTLEADLEEKDGGTQVELTIDVDPGRLFSMAGPLFKRQMKKQLEQDLDNLKAALEG